MLAIRLIFASLFVSLTGFASALHFKTDSLKNIVRNDLAKNGGKDTVTINHLNKLAGAYIDTYPDSTLHYGQLAIKMARSIHYQRGVAEALVRTGKVRYFKGDYSQAGSDLNEARDIYSKINDKQGLAHCYDEIGHMYNRIGNYNLAMQNLETALNIAKSVNYERVIAETYVDMGTVSDNKGKSSVALDYYFKSLAIDIRLNNQLEMARNYNDIGVILQNMEIYPKALEYFNKCLKIWLSHNDGLGISTAYENIGEVMVMQKKYDDAIVYLQRSLKIAIKQEDKDGISSLYNDLGRCYAGKKDFKKALQYLGQGLAVSTNAQIDYNRAISYVDFAMTYNAMNNYAGALKYAQAAKTLADKLGSLNVRSNAALQLSTALGGLKQYDRAYAVQKEYDDLKDSLKSDENVQKLTSYNLEENFVERQKQQQLQQQERERHYQENLRQQKMLLAIFMIIIVGMIIIVMIYYRGRKKQQQINSVLEEKNAQVSQQKTDLDEQAHKLNDLNSLKDRLISILAHDLRAPLSTLRGLFSLLQDATLSHEELLDMIPQVLKRLEYTSDFLDTLLFWINSQMENFDSSAKNFDIGELAAIEVSNHTDQALEKGINMTNTISQGTMVSADVNSIRIVLRNLMTNAIKFSRNGDSITVSATLTNDNYLLVSVKDTGTGMQPAQQEKLFKGKVTSSTGTGNESGTGMGLLFCKDLIEKSNGRIWVTSQLGKGTEFCFTLPAAPLKPVLDTVENEAVVK